MKVADLLGELGSTWDGFLQIVELTRNHDKFATMEGARSPSPLLDHLLPTLLTIRLSGLLDDALEEVRLQRGVEFPQKSKHDLFNRIELLRDELQNPEGLHQVRETRNDAAHPGKLLAWSRLYWAIGVVEEELRSLGLVGARPRYEFFAERSVAEESDDPNVVFTQRYAYGLKRDGKVVVEVSWNSSVLKS